jgi:hypothetical protein
MAWRRVGARTSDARGSPQSDPRDGSSAYLSPSCEGQLPLTE